MATFGAQRAIVAYVEISSASCARSRRALSLEVHRVAEGRSWRRAPGLRSQLLRSIASVASNLAEGAGEATKAQFATYVSHSIASANESETHLRLAIGLALVRDAKGAELLDELDQVRRMSFALRKYLARPDAPPASPAEGSQDESREIQLPPTP